MAFSKLVFLAAIIALCSSEEIVSRLYRNYKSHRHFVHEKSKYFLSFLKGTRAESVARNGHLKVNSHTMYRLCPHPHRLGSAHSAVDQFWVHPRSVGYLRRRPALCNQLPMKFEPIL